MIFKGESLKEKYVKLNDIYSKLQQLQQKVFKIDKLIKDREMRQAKDKIIEISQEYAKIFEEINKLIEKYT
jgi:protein subunit release factor A